MGMLISLAENSISLLKLIMQYSCNHQDMIEFMLLLLFDNNAQEGATHIVSCVFGYMEMSNSL